MEKYVLELQAVLDKYRSLGISQQIDYDKFYLYSIITHSTAIEGSTVTEIENQLLFDEGISAKGKPLVECHSGSWWSFVYELPEGSSTFG